MPQPSCPVPPPTDGESCGDDQACFYDGCPDAGLTRAACYESVWHVRTTPCCPDTAPTIGDACSGDDYFCVYSGDCPGGDVSQLYCDAGVWTAWGVSPHSCCPTEPPGSAVTCGPDMTEQMGPSFIQYSCGWQDCSSYGAADGTCGATGSLTSYWTGSCERFFCGSGNTDPDYYCEAGQVCIQFSLLLPGGGVGRTYRCADNPCPPGVLELGGCISEAICPTATGVSVVGAQGSTSRGIYVNCLL